MNWTEDKIEEVRSMAAFGFSGGDVASYFRVSRSSVLGIAHRNGIKFLGEFNGGQPTAKRGRKPTKDGPAALGRAEYNRRYHETNREAIRESKRKRRAPRNDWAAIARGEAPWPEIGA